MNGATIKRLADQLMALPEEEREALLASLAVPRQPSRPSPQGQSRDLPAPRSGAVITCAIEWV
ncbi:hypothetical protein SEA_MANEEKUL_49 [Streptomyces phage Maneekul]|nr:hypothetical protein SEA_MANEEKUL_49 [Streptomyces phage Maneekul]QDK03219.1 hypothetical protein SEA_TUANPN_48 [Streptomyces phage TuanPN]QZE11117.1 hypothetical protein SEA_SARAHROSE_49 [Streptomyces phage SarahRose]USH46058.1 hypothetical protein SEA_EJEMPLO_48 [Streptomyces phage Ejemplo]WAB09832.1 hypothetical protein SEA_TAGEPHIGHTER_51 [Streptomyces phage TagePhighter]